MSNIFKYNYTSGKKGEQLAEKLLKEKGFFIAARNYKSARGEIDIIAENEEYVVFAEVKLRQSNENSLPREAVNKKKVSHITFTARNYIFRSRTNLVPRFDIIEVIIPKDGNILKAEIKHIENAFEVNRNEFY